MGKKRRRRRKRARVRQRRLLRQGDSYRRWRKRRRSTSGAFPGTTSPSGTSATAAAAT